MLTIRQTKDFADSVLNTDNLLDAAIEWIQNNLSPKDVFEEKELLAWAQDQQPDDIFTQTELEDWANNNGMWSLDEE